MRGSYTKMFASILLPSLDRTFDTHYRARTECNLAATALAIRWYQVEHNNQFPKSLDELIPKYLPAVPIDYLDGKPIRYRADGAKPMIWSVGQNEIDDGGSAESARKNGIVNGVYDRWGTKDAVVYLTRQPRPTTQPVP